ncbi:MAG: hypothetical protein LBH63_04755, partial [Clostridiales Family XIII bacterium]|nr:hypothetical protein [Clostridiales Family XIII bacterium]
MVRKKDVPAGEEARESESDTTKKENEIAELEAIMDEAEEETSDDAPEGVRAMPMIPLRGLSIFPYMVLHF